MKEGTKTALAPQDGGVLAGPVRTIDAPVYTPFIKIGGAHEMFTPDDLGDIDFNGISETLQGKKVSDANLIEQYLSFDDLQNKPILVRYAGMTLRPALDFRTKEPIVDADGIQQLTPAVRLYDPESKQMYVNQAFSLVKCCWDNDFPIKQGLQITFTGLKRNSRGNNQQQFIIQRVEG